MHISVLCLISVKWDNRSWTPSTMLLTATLCFTPTHTNLHRTYVHIFLHVHVYNYTVVHVCSHLAFVGKAIVSTATHSLVLYFDYE